VESDSTSLVLHPSSSLAKKEKDWLPQQQLRNIMSKPLMAIFQEKFSEPGAGCQCPLI